MFLAENGICAAMWSDWWGFKLEAYDTVFVRTLRWFMHSPNSCAIIHSDSDIGIQRLNQEAAKAMGAGRRIGIDLAPKDAIAWITANPGKGHGD